MRIALAHYSAVSDISGVTTWFENLVLRLQRDGLSPCVHLNHFGSDPEESSLLPVLRNAGVRVEAVSRARTLEEDVKKTIDFLQRTKPTIFLPQCLNAHYFAAAMAGRQGLPWVLTIHSDDPDYWSITEARRPADWGGRTVCVSEHLAREVSVKGLDISPVVIPCGVEIPENFSSYNSKPFNVVYSGRLVETQKRLSLVIDVLIRSCLANPSIVATVIGEGPSSEACLQAVANAGLNDRIRFTGRLAPEQVKAQLFSAQAIVLMSDFEGLPVALLEAMAAGVVPVVRAIPSGIPEIVHHEETGLLVDENPEHAAQALCRLATDQVLWQKCSSAGRDLVRDQFSEDVCYRRWLDLIQELHSKSTVSYPISLPRRLDLPAPNTRLGAGYPAQRSYFRRMASCIKRSLTQARKV